MDDTRGPSPPPRFGAYELLEELGRGAMGIVYRARHAPTGAIRALKVVAGNPDPVSMARFRREIETLARAGGDGIVPVHEAGEERGRLYLVMGFMPGGSLRSRLRAAGRLDWREAVRILIDLARALDRCHAAGIVHRDLKPDNVLFDEAGKPHLADFGAVRDFKAASLTETGAAVGTPVYMAPEQLDGSRVDARADVYALGVLLVELVTGAPPHAEAKTIYQMLAAKRAGTSSSFDGAPGAPRRLDAIVRRALAVSPSERQGSAGELALELERLLSKDGSERRWLRVVGPALGVAALAVAIGFLLARPAPRHVEGPPPPPTPGGVVPVATSATPRIKILSETGSREWTHSDGIATLAVSSDGTRVLSGGYDERARLWDVASGKELCLLAPPSPEVGILCAADFLSGGRVVTVARRRLCVWDPGRGPEPAPTTILELPGDARLLAVAGDRAMVAWTVGDDGGRAALWNAARTGELGAAFPIDKSVVALALSADGRKALTGGSRGLDLWDLDGDEPRSHALEEHGKNITAAAFLSDGRILSTALVGEEDAVVRISDADGRVQNELPTYKKKLQHIAVRGGRALAASEKTIRLLDLERFEWAGDQLKVHPWLAVGAIALHPDGHRAVTSRGHLIQQWDVEQRRELSFHEGHEDAIKCLAVSADGTHLVSACDDGKLRIATVSPEGTLAFGRVFDGSPFSATPAGLGLSSSGTHAAWAGGRRVTIWDLAAETRTDRDERDANIVYGCSMSPDGRYVASTQSPGGVQVWLASSGALETQLDGDELEPRSIAFSPDGGKVLVGGRSLWEDWRSGPRKLVLPELRTPMGIAWSPDSSRFAAGDFVGTVAAGDADGHVHWVVHDAHRGRVRAVVFSDDGKVVLSAADDGLVRLFVAATGAPLPGTDAIARAQDYVSSAVALPGSRRIVVGTARGKVLVLELLGH